MNFLLSESARLSLIAQPAFKVAPQKDKKPKSIWRFNLDITHSGEDGICHSGSFEQFRQEKFFFLNMFFFPFNMKAATPIRTLAWELPYAVGAALKRKEKAQF
uniref:Uncharacterized protein n=1 Tax=Sus scrofa TaxID=9823 RepID=A0A8D1W345_PIG